jgi:hypothetical protein
VKIKITSQHPHHWSRHGFFLKVGENIVDDGSIPEIARARLVELEKAGALSIEPYSEPEPPEEVDPGDTTEGESSESETPVIEGDATKPSRRRR